MRELTLIFLCGALLGCGGDANPAAPEESASQVPDVPADPEGPQGPRYGTDDYELAAVADSAGYRVGQLGRVAISVQAKGRWHVSDEFPLAVRLEGPEALAFAKSTMGREDAAEAATERVRFDVPVTPSAPGAHEMRATIDFALCEATLCLPHTITLSLPLQVQ